jgi:hypothetical protein
LLKSLGTTADPNNPTNPFAFFNSPDSGNNLSNEIDPVTGERPYGGDLSKPGKWEAGEWVND